jgi:hypothetical protein
VFVNYKLNSSCFSYISMGLIYNNIYTFELCFC